MKLTCQLPSNMKEKKPHFVREYFYIISIFLLIYIFLFLFHFDLIIKLSKEDIRRSLHNQLIKNVSFDGNFLNSISSKKNTWLFWCICSRIQRIKFL